MTDKQGIISVRENSFNFFKMRVYDTLEMCFKILHAKARNIFFFKIKKRES